MGLTDCGLRGSWEYVKPQFDTKTALVLHVCAQYFAKMNLFLFLLISVTYAQRESRHKKFDRTTKEMIEEFEHEIPKITLGKGTNMGSHSDAKSLQSEVAAKIGNQYVGVAINIQNYSPFLLTDVHKHVEYGWPEPDAGYLPKHTFHDVRPKHEEVFLFHNRGWRTEANKRNSRGSISWQLKRSNGNNLTVVSDLAPFEHFLRLQLSWDIPFAYCQYGHTSGYKDFTNKVMVGELSQELRELPARPRRTQQGDCVFKTPSWG